MIIVVFVIVVVVFAFFVVFVVFYRFVFLRAPHLRVPRGQCSGCTDAQKNMKKKNTHKKGYSNNGGMQARKPKHGIVKS